MLETVWVVFIATNLHINIVGSKRVVIYDTLKESALKWTTNSQIPEEGWIEESITDIRDGINARSYVTCEVEKENVDNWLRMPYVERREARRLSVEIRFTVRDCKLYPRLARTCKETFTLHAYESDLNFASKNEPAWSDKVYTRVGRITTDLGRFSDRRNVQTNVEVRSVPVTKKGVYFAFRDEGACVSILGVKIFYEVCEETVTNFAWFAETPSGPDLSSIQSTVGHCVDNASPPSGVQPKYVCKADGTWDLLNGGCQCNRGYRADGQRCIACEPGTYKENHGLGQCQPCPDRSSALATAAAYCVCDAGYYRAFQDPKNAPCTRPPSRPERAELLSVDQTSAVLKWNQPSDLGGRPDLWYRIECQECPPGAQYSPAKTRFNTTRLTLTNLEPDVVYTVFVYAENDVSAQVDGLPMYAVVEVQTKASSPWLIANFRIESVTDSQVTLSWDPPRISMDYEPLINRGDNKHDPIYGLETELDRRRTRQFVQYYQIRYHRSYDKKSLFNRTASYEPKITLNNLADNTDYFFEVRPYTSKGWGAWSEQKHARTSASMSVNQEESTSTATIAITTFLIVLMILGLLFLVFLRRRILPHWYKKRTSDLDTLEYKTDQTNVSPDYHSVGIYNRKFNSPFIYPTVKPYVDPTTYEDPNMMLKEFTNEIDVSSVFIEEIIGAGEFGEVCKGYLKLAAEPETPVAIKTLKPGSSDKDKSDFLTEASIMGQFNHPNVIKLVGVVSKAEPVMIVTEYVENRSLDSFLRANDGKLTNIQLVQMLCGIAQGMKYLNDKGFIHRDLAARNVLVSGDLTCKIADFGLSRGVGGSADLVYTTKGGKIPVRWTAPEAIKFRKFTSASDVWSFGILMWEVMSFGERPYWDWTNQVVIQKVDEGFRLPPPMDCPAPLHRLMSECWNKDRQYRPSFVSIIQTLQNFVRCPELLYATTVYPSLDPINNHCLLNLNSVTPPTVHYNSRPVPPPPSTNHHRATPGYCGYGTLHRRPTIVDQSDCVVGQIIMDTVLYDENRRTPNINNSVGQQQQQSGLYCLKRLPQPRIV